MRPLTVFAAAVVGFLVGTLGARSEATRRLARGVTLTEEGAECSPHKLEERWTERYGCTESHYKMTAQGKMMTSLAIAANCRATKTNLPTLGGVAVEVQP